MVGSARSVAQVWSRLRTTPQLAWSKYTPSASPQLQHIRFSSTSPTVPPAPPSLPSSSSSSVRQNALLHHNDKVMSVSAAIAAFHKRKQKFRIFHGSTNSTRPRAHSHAANVVDTSGLNQVLHVDTSPDNPHVLVEPNVSMDRLVEATLEHNHIPKVVMEFPGITVGGGYSGTSGESSSFRHGFFDQTINEVEMVLADGTVTRCSRTEKEDLFRGAAGALGTLGVTTLVNLQLIPAKRYVEVEYIPVTSVEEAMSMTTRLTQDETIDYLDGILFSHTHGAIIAGRLTNSPSHPSLSVQTFSKPSDPWFYLHVQAATTNTTAPFRECIPLPDYLFRYDRGGFWVGASAFAHLKFPFNRYTRAFLDDFLHTRMMYTALHASGQSRSYVVQDLAMPFESVPEFVTYCNGSASNSTTTGFNTDAIVDSDATKVADTDSTVSDSENTDLTSSKSATAPSAGLFNIWPLWLCPLKQSPAPTMHPHTSHPCELLMNIGLWGFGPRDPERFISANIALEKTLNRLRGMKWLYAHTYYPRAEFWSQFDEKHYNDLRRKYGAERLVDVYEKVRVDVERQRREAKEWKSRISRIWPLGALYGLWKAVQSRTYIEARKAAWMKWEMK